MTNKRIKSKQSKPFRRRKYKRRDTFSVNINVDTDDNTLEWINNQKYLSKATLDIIKQYVNKELIHVDIVKQMLDLNNKTDENIEDKNSQSKAEERTNNVIDENTNIEIEEQDLDFKPKVITKKLINLPEEE